MISIPTEPRSISHDSGCSRFNRPAEVILPWILGMCLGVFVGAIPGLTATMATAILVPITYYLPPMGGLAMILGCACVSIFAGDIPATYLRVPGTPSSGAAILDGYEMTKQGEASRALSLDLTCSSLGGIVGLPCFSPGPRVCRHRAEVLVSTNPLGRRLRLATCVIHLQGHRVKCGIAVAIASLSTLALTSSRVIPCLRSQRASARRGRFIPAMIGCSVFRWCCAPL